MVFLFWVSLFAIFYAYLGYPLVLLLFSIFKRKRTKFSKTSITPTVSLLISAYNEEKVIEEKLKNSLSLDYPKALLEILVISDGSDDKTDEIVKRYADQGIILRSYQGRIGKTACLNKAIQLTKGDIIVFSDANSYYDRNAIRELVQDFADEGIGFVTGTTEYISEDIDISHYSVGLYTKMEQITKKLENKMGSCVGADGAIFAVRKHLYQPLHPFDINDLVIPLNIIRQGYRGIFNEKAFCKEKLSRDDKEDFNRQARITNRTIRAIFNNINLLNPFEFGLFSYELFSHKLSKFSVPFFMVTLLITNLFLIPKGPLFVLFLAGQLFFYLLAWLGFLRKNFASLSKLAFLCKTFLFINLAISIGWIKYFKRETFTTWTVAR